MCIADNMRRIRKQRGYSQEELAEILNTTQQQYSKYENGVNEIPVHHVITLCRFYNITSDWLLGLKETEE